MLKICYPMGIDNKTYLVPPENTAVHEGAVNKNRKRYLQRFEHAQCLIGNTAISVIRGNSG